jgi:CRISPR-associated endonuclease/helicase Cas3
LACFDSGQSYITCYKKYRRSAKMPSSTPQPLYGLPYFIAHTPSKLRPDHWHSLPLHLKAVAEYAGRAAAAAFQFSGVGGVAESLARYLGLRHDLGKFTEEFQTYLWECHLATQKKGPRPQKGSAPHKQAGALAATQEAGDFGLYLALALQGHHGGMPACRDIPTCFQGKTDVKSVECLMAFAKSVDSELAPIIPDSITLINSPLLQNYESAEMCFRFLYSCLVDGDSVDTEAHDDPKATRLREEGATTFSLAELRDRLREKQEDLRQKVIEEKKEHTEVNRVRREVYTACVEAAALPPGIFTLTVPTGGGKTRSSLAFSLEHAVTQGRRRVVYAIPYTSIVDQTASVFRDIFKGMEGVVLEHHSAIEPPDFTSVANKNEPLLWQRLAAQNWDAPLIVTTTVQLFESLFSNRPSKCRKLHRLAGSVLVLDEVQTLPVHLLTPLLSGLKTLVKDFGVTIVLCTATQPAFAGESPVIKEFSELTVTPIIPDPAPHFAALKRVTYRVETEESWTWEQVAETMREAQEDERSALCIVNTRRQALALMDVLDPDGSDPDVLHLSTLLCGRHRRAVLDEVRERLINGPPVLVVSTTVVECGVDLDFPLVLRAEGPLDRIIQAAGRCNREGLRPVGESEVIVFRPADGKTPGGIYDTALSETQALFTQALARGEDVTFDDPAFVTRYFAQLFNTIGKKQLDVPGVQERRSQFDYPEVANKVRLIADDTVSVLVKDCPGGEKDAADIIAEASRLGRMSRDLWQKAQQLSVSLYRRDADPDSRHVSEVVPGLFVWEGDAYHPKRGLPLPEDPTDVVYKPGSLIVG